MECDNNSCPWAGVWSLADKQKSARGTQAGETRSMPRRAMETIRGELAVKTANGLWFLSFEALVGFTPTEECMVDISAKSVS